MEVLVLAGRDDRFFFFFFLVQKSVVKGRLSVEPERATQAVCLAPTQSARRRSVVAGA